MAAITDKLVVRFGDKAAAGILFRVGRSCFTQIIKDLGERVGFTRTEFKILPLKRKIPRGLELLAEVFQQINGNQIHIQEDPQFIFWERTASEVEPVPVCTFYTGLLQEYMAWMGSGRVYLVDENACRFQGGSSCIHRIHKLAID